MIVTDDEGWLFYRGLENSLRILTELLLTIPQQADRIFIIRGRKVRTQGDGGFVHYKTRSTRMVSDMINNPVKQLPIINLTSRQTDTQLDQFIICTIRQKAVHFQKCQHNQMKGTVPDTNLYLKHWL